MKERTVAHLLLLALLGPIACNASTGDYLWHSLTAWMRLSATKSNLADGTPRPALWSKHSSMQARKLCICDSEGMLQRLLGNFLVQLHARA